MYDSIKMKRAVEKVDKKATTTVYHGVGSIPLVRLVPRYLGLIPFELYVMPGMFVAIAVLLYTGSTVPIQVHLLPQMFTYAVISILKEWFPRTRPACDDSGIEFRDSDSTCDKRKSFPSGHSAQAAALGTALLLYIWSSEPKPWSREWDVPISVAISVVCVNVMLHRIVYGYHHVLDVLVGAGIGFCIGAVSFVALAEKEDASTEFGKGVWEAVRWFGIVLSLLAAAFYMVKNTPENWGKLRRRAFASS